MQGFYFFRNIGSLPEAERWNPRIYTQVLDELRAGGRSIESIREHTRLVSDYNDAMEAQRANRASALESSN